MEQNAPVGLVEMTPGFTSLLLEFKPRYRPDPAALLREIRQAPLRAPEVDSRNRPTEIPVVYDGPDLGRVAQGTGLNVSEVVRLHAGTTYLVQILGFAPGFPYLSGLDRRLHVPRLATPRPRIPAGSVAIGGEHTGIYPVATAGGWNLLGRTSFSLMDPALAAQGLATAFRLKPGDWVRFIPVDAIPGT